MRMDQYVGTTEEEAKPTHVQSEALSPNTESVEAARSTHVQSMTLLRIENLPQHLQTKNPFLRTIRQTLIRAQVVEPTYLDRPTKLDLKNS